MMLELYYSGSCRIVKSGGRLSRIKAVLSKFGLDLAIQAEQPEQLRLN
jgi:hypothetical protein